MKPFETAAGEGINACAVNYNLDILGIAGEKGVVELWDLKDKKKVIGLPLLDNSFFQNYE